MQSVTSKGLRHVSLYNRRPALPNGYGLEHVPFLILYAICLYHCYQTIGDPYAAAVAELEQKGVIHGHTSAVVAGSGKDAEPEDMASSVLSSGIVREDAKALAEEEEYDILAEHSLPNPFLPGFFPLLALATVTILHILMKLLQVWSVSVLTLIKYSPASDVASASYVKAIPKQHRGKTELVRLVHPPTKAESPYFMFQRRKFIYDGGEKKTFRKLHMPTDHSLRWYTSSPGLTNSEAIDERRKLYGGNRFDIPMPEFMDLFKQQLVAPLTVFQIFCVMLWMLDQYWQYSAFTLVMIVVFEGITSFSRLKNLKTLRGMGNEAADLMVYRCNRWQTISSEDLLPGDICSIKRTKKNDVIPADCLLLSGSAVVNEATLTGESVPQMKEAVSKKEGEDAEAMLDMKGLHKVHILYCGTKMMQHDEYNASSEDTDQGTEKKSEDLKKRGENKTPQNPGAPARAPDGGCVCFVLRTGFSSSQGKLVRMIEYSSENVSQNTLESLLLILFLLLFALVSSGYVLKKGLEDENRGHFELLLHCVLIITSVIPPELPIQMALAVNSALVALVKLQIFCTEPFRIPLAGKVDICMFDKTGTITTDQLNAVGVVNYAPKLGKPENSNAPKDVPAPMTSASIESALILGGCHSLVQIDGKTVGDPVEEAAMNAIKFKYNPSSRRSMPLKRSHQDRLWAVDIDPNKVWVDVIHRNHFASRLQRMSVIGRVSTGRGSPQLWSLVKGSPEAIEKLLLDEPGVKPDWYSTVYRQLVQDGMRVLALAYKSLDKTSSAGGQDGAGASEFADIDVSTMNDRELSKLPRAFAESDLRFAGFVAFSCLVRKDSGHILQQLSESSHHVTMITGDAVLTAIHVAAEVNIVTKPRNKTLMLQCKSAQEGNKTESERLCWVNAETDEEQRDFVADEISKLCQEGYDLCVSGAALSEALKRSPRTRDHLTQIRVFARMTPEAKEDVLMSLKERGHFTLMCGDGANDVGALKQAHVGLALLSGFGSANADKDSAGKSKRAAAGKESADEAEGAKDGARKKRPSASKFRKDPNSGKAATSSSSSGTSAASSGLSASPAERAKELNRLHVSALRKILRDDFEAGAAAESISDKSRLVQLILAHEEKERQETKAKESKKRADMIQRGIRPPQALTPEEKKLLMERKQRELEEDVARREAAGESFARMKAMYAFAKREAAEAQKLRGAQMGSGGFAASAQKLAEANYDMEDGEVPMVKLGDASIASPFTSKVPSIRGAVDVVRQGRCALVTTLQMYQILALNCLISSYSLSVLYLDGVKYGDRQMTATGILMTISFLTLSRAKPLQKLSEVRPLLSIFHPALFLSLLGQFAIHLGCMMYGVAEAKRYLPSDVKLDVNDTEFKPNLVNTIVFLISTVQQVSVFAVNYKGYPFMQGITENPGLLYSLGLCAVGMMLSATEAMPSFNNFLELVAFPDDRLARLVFQLVVGDIVGTFIFDRLMVYIFAPQILKIQIRDTSMKEVKKIVKMIVMMLLVIYFFTPSEETLEEMQKIAKEAGY